MSGMTVVIAGVIGRKAKGIKDGEGWRSVTIDYMGGSQALYGLSQQEFDSFPEEGQPVQIQAVGKIDRNEKLRLSNYQLREAPAARRAA